MPGQFPSIHTHEGLLPADLLRRLERQESALGGLRPEDYGVGQPLREVISRAWSRARLSWQAFQAAIAGLHEGESGVTETREQWLRPLLRELGWQDVTFQAADTLVGERRFALTHRDGPVPLLLTGCRQELDRSWQQPARRLSAPHTILQDYLNASGTLYGIVSNGLTLRLLRQSETLAQQRSLEVDLQLLFTDDRYADFTMLFLLFHRSRFPQDGEPAESCWLERWRRHVEEQGVRALAAMRQSVQEALLALGDGLLQHPANEVLRQRLARGKLAAVDFYRQLLRLVYRIIVLATAEERDLLFPVDAPPRGRMIYEQGYSVSALRRRAGRARGDDRHDDLFRGFQQTVRLVQQGEERLGLRGLGGELFGPAACPDLDGAGGQPPAQLMNAACAQALWALSTVQVAGVRHWVSYHDLDTEELGGIYEGLLERQPLVEGVPPRLTWQESLERKQTGSYYTPPALVAQLVETALAPVVEARLAGAPAAAEREQALLALRVLDPACGSGHFLLAAGRWLAVRLAQLRSGGESPPPTVVREAMRAVVRSCLYAVDRNPLAVDLCKLALWLESQQEGLPLSFLDGHVRLGDSLVGAWDLDAVTGGIPEGAYAPVTGDDREAARRWKALNARQQRQLDVAQSGGGALRSVAADFAVFAGLAEQTPEDVAAKRALYEELRHGPQLQHWQWACDLWTYAFFAPLVPGTAQQPEPVPLTAHVQLARAGRSSLLGPLLGAAAASAQRQCFFHWPLEFPEIFLGNDDPGFDCVLGNPPWDKLEMDEQEFFRTRAPEIAALAGVRRKQAIARLTLDNPSLWQAFVAASAEVAGIAKFAKASGRFPLTGGGRINLYALFAELAFELRNAQGRAGVIVPTNIATDDSTKRFFGAVTAQGQLVSLFDFENRRKLFPAVDSRYRFSLLTLGVAQRSVLAFMLQGVEELSDARRRFHLGPADFARFNPNTRTCPIFRTQADEQLTRKIYERVPVLVDEGRKANPWGVRFLQGLFNMTSDSALFRSEPGPGRVPLYEAKLFHQFTHRWATYCSPSQTRDLTAAELRDPAYIITPRYWVEQREVEQRLAGKWEREWLLAFRNVTNATNERTLIAALLPRVGVGNSAPLLLSERAVEIPALGALLLANLNALVLDYVARQKAGGVNLNFFIVEQLPILPPDFYRAADLAFITPRVIELVYTSWELVPFARDLGYDGPPFLWDDERRALLRAELDAYYARLYGLTRAELCYVLDPAAVYGEDFPGETFRVLQKSEIERYGEYRTERLVLEAWDRLEGRSPTAWIPPSPSVVAESRG